uniref:ABC transporter ATP-binding protein n=1 Tax=Alistipes sp. TaxID=1872444 RepID=UPI00405656CF
MVKHLIHTIIPPRYRRRAGWVVLTIFLRALLNFVGVAALVPVLMVILENEQHLSTGPLGGLYAWGGFTSSEQFAVAVAVGVVVVLLLKGLLNMGLYLIERDYIFGLYRTLSRTLFLEYYNRGLDFIKHANSAHLSRNVNGVTFSFVAGVLRPMATILSEVLLLLLIFVAICQINARVGLLVLLLFIPVAWLYYWLVRRRLNRYGERENRAHREKARVVIEAFRGYADVEINGAMPLMLKRFDRAMGEIVDVQQRNATLGLLPSFLTEVGLALGMALLVVVGSRTAAEDTPLLFGLFAVAALRLMPSIRSLMGSWAAIKYNRYTIDILAENLPKEGDQPTSKGEERPITFEQEIELRNLTFHYADAPEQKILDNLSMKIKRGEYIGIRGESGAGKTTLFNLLLGFYSPTSGEILVDGTPLKGEVMRAWRNRVGYVSQQVFLMDGTFAENVALGLVEEEIAPERLRSALRVARLLSFVDGLKSGVNTPIGECGCRLSGGQRQRIGIARALYRGADLLLFDEATSALDDQTEEEINRSIRTLAKENPNLTVIVIAHRRTTLEGCDRIIDL